MFEVFRFSHVHLPRFACPLCTLHFTIIMSMQTPLHSLTFLPRAVSPLSPPPSLTSPSLPTPHNQQILVGVAYTNLTTHPFLPSYLIAWRISRERSHMTLRWDWSCDLCLCCLLHIRVHKYIHDILLILVKNCRSHSVDTCPSHGSHKLIKMCQFIYYICSCMLCSYHVLSISKMLRLLGYTHFPHSWHLLCVRICIYIGSLMYEMCNVCCAWHCATIYYSTHVTWHV